MGRRTLSGTYLGLGFRVRVSFLVEPPHTKVEPAHTKSRICPHIRSKKPTSKVGPPHMVKYAHIGGRGCPHKKYKFYNGILEAVKLGGMN